jgi:hypothetical protein
MNEFVDLVIHNFRLAETIDESSALDRIDVERSGMPSRRGALELQLVVGRCLASVPRVVVDEILRRVRGGAGSNHCCLSSAGGRLTTRQDKTERAAT